MSNGFLSTKNVSVDYQVGGPGRGQRRILDVSTDTSYGMGEWTDSLGAITRDWYRDPSTNQMRPMPVRRGNPEPITFPLTCRMKALNLLEQFSATERLAIHKRYVGNLSPSNLLNYSRIEVFTDCAIVDRGYSAGATDGRDEENWVDLTANINAGSVSIILPVAGKSIPHGISGANDVSLNCITADDSGTLWIGTVNESAGAPYIFKGVRDVEGNITWTGYTITGQTSPVTTLAVAGDYLVFGIGTNICRAAMSDPSTITTVAFGATVNKIVAIDAANLIAVGASGTVKMSNDGGLSWTAITSGVSASLSSIAVRNYNDWWIGGASGSLLHYTKGTLTALSDPTGGDTINTIALPENRPDDVYIGTNGGEIFYTINGGSTWTEYRFPGDNAGNVNLLAFADWMGPVLYIVHTPVSGPTRLLRDLSGGVGGNTNVETITVPSNIGFNDIFVEGVNDVFLVGDVASGTNLIVKVEA